MDILIEACCDSLQSVRAAATAGADRIELCRELPTDGLTPLPETLREAKQIFSGPVNVLIRLREGNFVYTPLEVAMMTSQIRELSDADGFVIGALTEQGEVDTEAVRQMMAACGGKPVTFHRAFDCVASPTRALEDVIACGCARVLSSGCSSSAIEGAEILGRMKRQASGRIKILAGGGVTPSNIAELVAKAHPDEVHGSFSVKDSAGVAFTQSELIREGRQRLKELKHQ